MYVYIYIRIYRLLLFYWLCICLISFVLCFPGHTFSICFEELDIAVNIAHKFNLNKSSDIEKMEKDTQGKTEGMCCQFLQVPVEAIKVTVERRLEGPYNILLLSRYDRI